MTRKELIPGKYYFHTRDMWNYAYIFIWQGKHWIRTDDYEYYNNEHEYNSFYKSHQVLREATNEEKAWLDACIKAGGFVEGPRQIENYEVY